MRTALCDAVDGPLALMPSRRPHEARDVADRSSGRSRTLTTTADRRERPGDRHHDHGRHRDALRALGVPVTERPNGCLVFTGKMHASNFIALTIDGQQITGGRLAWKLWHRSPAPAGKRVRRTCRDSRCVAGEHLYIATPHVPRARQTKLNFITAEKIRRAYRRGGMRVCELAEVWGVHPSSICAILAMRAYKPTRHTRRTTRPRN
jgi:hypothetical protein